MFCRFLSPQCDLFMEENLLKFECEYIYLIYYANRKQIYIPILTSKMLKIIYIQDTTYIVPAYQGNPIQVM